MFDLLGFALYFGKITATMSIFTNGLLISLIIKATPPPLRAYSIHLLAYSTSDLSIGLPSLVAHPLTDSYENVLIVRGFGFGRYLGDTFCTFCFLLLCCGFCTMVGFTCFGFYFRYRTLSGKGDLSVAQVSAICVTIYFGVFATITALFRLVRFPADDEKALALYKAKYFQPYPFAASVIGSLDTPIYTLIWYGWHVFSSAFPIMGIMYIRRRLHQIFEQKASQLSEHTIKLHQQMLRNLNFQLITPCLLCAGSIAACWDQFYFHYHPLGTCIYLGADVAMVVNPLSSLYFIKVYRMAVINLFEKITCGVKMPVKTNKNSIVSQTSKVTPAST